jgi:hypothetical protein
MSVPTTGNDMADGKTAGTAKGTWAGMRALLNGTDPGNCKVTVQVSGLFSGGVHLYIPGYDHSNLLITGADQATDGWSGEVYIYGSMMLDKLCFGRLSLYGSYLHLENRTLRFTGVSPVNAAISLFARSGIYAYNTTFEFTGNHSSLIYISGGTGQLYNSAYKQIGGIAYNHFTNAYSGSIALNGPNSTFDFQTPPSVSSIRSYGGTLDTVLAASFPGGGKVTYDSPGISYIRGVARIGGKVYSDGSIITTYGDLAAITRESAGTYLLTINMTTKGVLVTPETLSDFRATSIYVSATQWRIYTRNASGALTDCNFDFAIF